MWLKRPGWAARSRSRRRPRYDQAQELCQRCLQPTRVARHRFRGPPGHDLRARGPRLGRTVEEPRTTAAVGNGVGAPGGSRWRSCCSRRGRWWRACGKPRNAARCSTSTRSPEIESEHAQGAGVHPGRRHDRRDTPRPGGSDVDFEVNTRIVNGVVAVGGRPTERRLRSSTAMRARARADELGGSSSSLNSQLAGAHTRDGGGGTGGRGDDGFEPISLEDAFSSPTGSRILESSSAPVAAIAAAFAPHRRSRRSLSFLLPRRPSRAHRASRATASGSRSRPARQTPPPPPMPPPPTPRARLGVVHRRGPTRRIGGDRLVAPPPNPRLTRRFPRNDGAGARGAGRPAASPPVFRAALSNLARPSSPNTSCGARGPACTSRERGRTRSISPAHVERRGGDQESIFGRCTRGHQRRRPRVASFAALRATRSRAELLGHIACHPRAHVVAWARTRPRARGLRSPPRRAPRRSGDAESARRGRLRSPRPVARGLSDAAAGRAGARRRRLTKAPCRRP